MKDRVLRTIDEYKMLPKGCSVVVGFSGGADSISLLHFLIQLKETYEIRIIAAHVNHCLRGKESERDENFVRKFCEDNNIEIRVLKIDVKSEAKKLGYGLEECGRNIRYEFFNSISSECSGRIATAHTLSDCMETTILNFARGTGLNGLCGIPPVRENIIRPFIFVTRKQIEEYCTNNGLTYITDSSNLSRDYARNKIRLDVIPILKQINPSFDNAALRMIDNITKDRDYLNELAECEFEKCRKINGFSAEAISRLPDPIKYRVIMKIISERCEIKLEATHLEMINVILNSGEGAVNIPGNYYVKVKSGIINVNAPKTPKIEWENKINSKEILTEQGRKFIIEDISIEEFRKKSKINKLLLNNALDYDTISSDTVIRNRRAGDIFCSAQRRVTKTIKKLFCENKIDSDQRNNIAMLACGNNILWVQGFGPSITAMITDSTQRVLIISEE